MEKNNNHRYLLASPDKIVEAEGVTSLRTRRNRYFLRRLIFAILQIMLAILVAWLLVLLPGNPEIPIYNWKNPVIVFVLVCFIGKTLLDTLFYDHYRP
jgi:uncharacterized protein YacL